VKAIMAVAAIAVAVGCAETKAETAAHFFA